MTRTMIWKGAPAVHGLWVLGDEESEEQVTLVRVIRKRRHKTTWTMPDPRKISLECEESSEVR